MSLPGVQELETEVATRMADILFKLGYIRKGHLITVTRDDLVGQYIGHTAPKTKEVLKQAMGGNLLMKLTTYTNLITKEITVLKLLKSYFK